MRFLLPAVLLGVVAACSSFSGSTVDAPDSGADDAGVIEAEDASEAPEPKPDAEAGSTAPVAATQNPYGVAYPTDHIGWHPRVDLTRGDRIGNHALYGYHRGFSTLSTVSLADLYDPQGKTHDVIVIVGCGAWDIYSTYTLQAVMSSKKRIATLAVLGEGESPAGVPATLADLKSFQTKYPSLTSALDSVFKVFRPAFDFDALPLVMVIDARTMEIARSAVGGLTTVDAIDAEVTKVTSAAAAY